MNLEKLKEKIKSFPRRPGIYFFKNAKGEVIYIGKARSLRDRVKSYFLPNPDLKVQNILSETEDVDYLLVSSEKEATFIENNYVRFYQPRFNLRLKDDKSFPFLKITIGEPFPGLYLCRRVEDDGARYFGPFSPAEEARRLLVFITRAFRLRTCENTVFRSRKRPCLEYDLKLCSAPCVGIIDQASYRENLERVLLLLEGRKNELQQTLRQEMERAAEELRFEEAARWRDTLKALESLKETQRVILPEKENLDLVGYAGLENRISIFIFHMREGRIRSSSGKIIQKTRTQPDQQLLVRSLIEFYSLEETPEKILLPFKIDRELENNLYYELKKHNNNIFLLYPSTRQLKTLLELANQNASLMLEKEENLSPLADLARVLGLKDIPRRIEGVDISTTSGEESVGSLVVFIDGEPVRSEYRKYLIKTVTGPDDFASIQEVLARRLSRLLKEDQTLPDLIFVDGGKGQLSVAREVLKSLGLTRIPVCSLAKKEEIIYSPNHPEGLKLEPSSPALKLLQHLRDETHRLAISFHRQRRQKKSFSSELDGIPGLGPVRRKKLLLTFGSLEAIKKASEESLSRIVGSHLARELKQRLG